MIEYLGEVIDEEECERRLNEDYAKGSFLFSSLLVEYHRRIFVEREICCFGQME